MDIQNPKPNFFLSHKFLYSVIGVLILVVIVGSVAWWEQLKNANLQIEKCIKEYQQSSDNGDCSASDINSTANWKIYTNEQYGFEFKYPFDWTLDTAEKDFIAVNSPESQKEHDNNCVECLNDINVFISHNPKLLSAKSFYDGQNGGYVAFDNPEYDKEIKIDGTTAYKVYPLTGIAPSVNVIIPKSNIFIEFTSYGDEAIFDQILSTFKFTNNQTNNVTGNGTLSGKVTIGPFCPVEREGMPCQGPDSAYTSTNVIVYKEDGTSVVASTNLDDTGNYSLNLPAGKYIVRYHTTVGFSGTGQAYPITITSGQTTTYDFSIDTGIR